MVEGMVEMNAAPVVSPLNSLDCARINVGREEGVKKKRVAAGKCQYRARLVAKRDGEEGKKEKEKEREGENNSRVSRRVSNEAYSRWSSPLLQQRRRLSGLIPNKLQS